MKRWILKSGIYDDSGLAFEDAALPQPGPGEVRVRVQAASLNYRDLLVMQNPLWRPQADLIPIADGAGVIDAVGEGVTKWSEGDAVITVYMRNFLAWPPSYDNGMGLGSGTEDGLLAQYVILSAERLVRAPKGLTPLEAATLPCAGHTAWTALQKMSQARPGDTVLILGSGGVSLFALAYCRALGIKAIITTSQESKRQRLLDMGASEVINYRDDPDWGNTVNRLTGGGVDKVINSVGVGSLNASMAALKPGGNVVTVGMISKAEGLEEYAFLGKGLTLHGIPVGGRDGLEELVAFVEATGLKPVIHAEVAFEDAPQAYVEQRSPELFGKVVVKVA